MPFQSAVDGPSSPAGAAVMRVEPDQVLRLMRELEDIRGDAQHFVRYEAAAMTPAPMGADPVSADVAAAVGRTAETAIACMNGFIEQLNAVIEALARTVRQYGLADEGAAAAFRGVER
ncbi:PE domain-containing protein [Umezawaea sp. Da 62-37]|uniref:PE domain-containing protein n=1 Tax=Umezawaea sp. Da 62-37 TaxID=3075927 RepID=UPI0028F6EC86|nr:PE domain-containing protein [Umezawaea sp. Da 62-37]WNV82081.1 PE domain-containing protein [Umezawaea sp. Da 62-37]